MKDKEAHFSIDAMNAMNGVYDRIDIISEDDWWESDHIRHRIVNNEEDCKIKTILIYPIVVRMINIIFIKQMIEFLSNNPCFRQISIFLFLYTILFLLLYNWIDL